MKTPDAIKKGLEACSLLKGCINKGCPYSDLGTGSICIPTMTGDALAYIQQLEAYKRAWAEVLPRISEAEDMKETIERLSKHLDRVKKERDAALHDLMMMGISADREYLCHFCGSDSPLRCEYCKDRSEEAFVWRGVCAENTEEEANED
jgi:hypothetical protein